MNPKTVTSRAAEDGDDLWGSIAAAPPKTVAQALNLKPAIDDSDDPWAAIAAPPPTTKAKPLAISRGRGTRSAAPKLGAQRINRTSSTGS